MNRSIIERAIAVNLAIRSFSTLEARRMLTGDTGALKPIYESVSNYFVTGGVHALILERCRNEDRSHAVLGGFAEESSEVWYRFNVANVRKHSG